MSGYGSTPSGSGSAGASPDDVDRGPASDRVRIRRKPKRGHYDAATINAILDDAIVGYVGWIRDGQPVVTPVNVWREGDRLLWHASVGSGLAMQLDGKPVCVTVAHVDALVLSRAATNHSVDYRSVMAMGTCRIMRDEAEVNAALDGLVDSLFPGRAATLRPTTAVERRATSVMWIPLDEASAKVRDVGLIEDEGDETWPAWGGVVPVRSVRGEPRPDQYVTDATPVPEIRLPR